MDTFIQAVSHLVPLSPCSIQALSSVLVRQELPKKEILVRQNRVCNHVYFIEKGLTRTYYYKDGREVTDWISAENTFACSVISYLSRQPDRRIIELLEPSVLWSFEYNQWEVLCRQYHEVEHLGRCLLHQGIIQMQRRFDELHFSTALERYQNLVRTNASLLQRVPLGIIASYLGMTQETLSRIRSQY
jgi:CRP-like cAMP-binding protein